MKPTAVSLEGATTVRRGRGHPALLPIDLRVQSLPQAALCAPTSQRRIRDRDPRQMLFRQRTQLAQPPRSVGPQQQLVA